MHSNELEVINLADITGLNFYDATVKFIPSGIGRHFVNLKVLHIVYCRLLSVNKENLKEFGNSLEYLSIQSESIKLISTDVDLLECNPNLEDIYLNDNPIRHIDTEFFANLKNMRSLKVAYLQDATNCMDQYFRTSKGQKHSDGTIECALH